MMEFMREWVVIRLKDGKLGVAVCYGLYLFGPTEKEDIQNQINKERGKDYAEVLTPL